MDSEFGIRGSGFGRREFLAAAGGVALAPALLSAAEESPGWIDAHVHVWTPDIEKYPLAEGYRREDMQPPSFTPAQLMEHARPVGVRRVVLIQMSFYGFDNQYMLDVIRDHPGVYSGVAVIDEQSRPAERMRELKPLGVRGFRIRPAGRAPDQWLAGDGMREMWRCGAEQGQAMCHLIDAEFLPSVDAMCERHPETPVVIDHFARIGVDGEIRERDVAALCRLARHRHARVKVSAFYALGKKLAPYKDLVPMIRRLLDAYGPERLMWASDCPFQVVEGHAYRPSIELVERGLEGLSAGDRDWLLRRTAEQTFFQ